MKVSNAGESAGRDCGSDAGGPAMNSTMACFPNSTKMGRFMFICWKHQVYQNVGSRTIVQLLGWVLWLRLSRYNIPERLLSMSQSTWLRPLHIPIGLQASIALGSVKNGLTLTLHRNIWRHGEFFCQHTFLMMRFGIGYDRDTDQLIREQEK